jgi:hypothetical protein
MSTPTVADFLAFRFRHNGPDDHIEIRTFKQDGWPGPREWFADAAPAARCGAALPQHLAVYYGTAARAFEGGKKEHVTSIPGAFGDLDFKRYPDGEAGAWAALAAFPLPPTWVINSGGGLQPYWDFVSPLTGRDQFAAFEPMLKRLAAALNGDPSVAEMARVLRLPGSYNSKPEYGTPRQVTIIRFNPENLYTLADFERLLPAPVEQPRQQSEYPRGGQGSADVPSLDELGEMLRHVDPQPGYHKWLSILAAIHSAYPGADGEALAEAWSGQVSKPGEIAAKFKSFGNYQGVTKKNATIATVIYEAKQAGWAPRRATYHSSHPADPHGYDVADPDLIATLTADVARLGDLLRERDATIAEHQEWRRRRDEEGERTVLRLTQLEEENQMLRAVIKHPDQTASVSAIDLDAAADRAYERNHILTQDGKDYARVPFSVAEDLRSDSTLSRGFARLREAGTIDAFTRTEKFTLPNGKVKEHEIAYIHKPPELRGKRGRAVLSILPSVGEKKHGGRRTIAVPAEVAAQPHPVKRTREYVTRWHDALTDKPITAQTEYLGKDFWTAQGEQLLPEEVTRQRVAEGYEPPRAAPTPIATRRATRQDGDYVNSVPSPQVDEYGATRFETVPGSCADAECTARVEVGGYCARHFAAYRQRHVAAYGFAAAGD